jgi:branched-chain amino acid transport system permease protein
MIQLLVVAAVGSCISFLLGVGCWVTLNYFKYFNCVLAACASCGAVVFNLGVNHFHLGVFPSVGISAAVGASIGLLCDFCFLSRMHHRGAAGWMMFVASSGLCVALINALSLITGDNVMVSSEAEQFYESKALGIFVTQAQAASSLCSLALGLCVALLVERTSFGRMLRAVACNPELASILGLRKWLIDIAASLIGYVCFSVAGALYAADVGATLSLGWTLLLAAYCVVLFAYGRGCLGLAVSSLSITAARVVISYMLDNRWTDSILYVFVVAGMLLLPRRFVADELRREEG